MEHKSHRIRIANIPQGRKIFSTDNKPMVLIISQFLLAVIFAMSRLKYVAIPVLIYAVILLFRKKENYISGYDSFLIITDPENSEYCDIIYHTEIRFWEFRIKNNDYQIMFYLNENEKYLLDHHVSHAMYDYLKKTLPDKEIRNRKEKLEKGV